MGWLVFGIIAQAASFDCAKAQSKVEHLICDNAEISKLDEELSAAYKTALQDEKKADSIKQEQKQWMKKRNNCVDAECVSAAYRNRITNLIIKPDTTGVGAPAQVKKVSREKQPKTRSADSDNKGTYALVMSKSDDMCNHMHQLMLNDLKGFHRTYDSNDRFVNSHDEFTTIPWKPARASYENGGKTFYTEHLEGAVFDINNDGVLDFVVKDSSMLSGMRADGIYIFDRSVANRANALTTKELFESKNQIDMAGGGYPLSAPLGGVGLMWLLSPFTYHDATYIYMQSLYAKDEAIGGDLVVISKYTGGKFAMREMTGMMEDICYIERVDAK